MWETLECPWPEVLEVLSPCCGSEGTEVTRCCPMGFDGIRIKRLDVRQLPPACCKFVEP